MRSVLIYDLEIIKAIPIKGEHRLPDIDYCRGWNDHCNMGISVICAYTLYDDTSHVFCEDNFEAFQQLVNDSEIICGFNSESFDDKVCEANGLEVITTYDILREVYEARGLDRYPQYYSALYKGYGLDAMCQANGLGAKIGHGAHAPVLWQQGKIGQVINYCLRDVRMTVGLLRKILHEECLFDPHDGKLFGITFDIGDREHTREEFAEKFLPQYIITQNTSAGL